mmetsp:Transcript_5893/g.8906  ORF Transcript_5893/g.8906 Transcript_5893/m.8906 type:complete len:373 (-) Transcript_5893:87-1205(-)
MSCFPTNIEDTNQALESIQFTQDYLPVPTKLASQSQPHDNLSQCTRITCMSDTHGKHRKIHVPKCDVLIHAGDFTKSGEKDIVTDLANFFEELVHNGTVGKVICIAGNHDITFQPETYRLNWGRFHPKSRTEEHLAGSKEYLMEKCTYLQDTSHEHDSIEYYGSPWTPVYGHSWAFMKQRSKIHEKWDQIPSSTDVLVVHGPPLGRRDKARFGVRAGCQNLLEQIQTRIKPRINIFGHIHEDRGTSYDGTTLYVNASNVTIKYSPENPCIVVDLPHDKDDPARAVLPECSFTSEEVLGWLKENGYDIIYPYFENRKPLLDGSALVREDLEIENLACKLKMHSFNVPFEVSKWQAKKEELSKAMIHLRSISYG